MKFNNKQMTFGRHETFALRYAWLTKGFQAFQKNPKVFEPDVGTLCLGVGKNMVSSIRYWLIATRLLEKPKQGFQVTEVGNAIFSEEGYDPYLEDEATIWLVHWLLASNAEKATTWFWFFNYYYKTEFSREEISLDLNAFISDNMKIENKIPPNENTLKKDINILLRMYLRSAIDSKTHLEDLLDAPLIQLDLVQLNNDKRYQSRATLQHSLPCQILGFALVELFIARKENILPITELMYAKGDYAAPGAVFKLTENALLAKIEQLSVKFPHIFEIRDDAGLHQVSLIEPVKPTIFLDDYYQDAYKVAA